MMFNIDKVPSGVVGDALAWNEEWEEHILEGQTLMGQANTAEEWSKDGDPEGVVAEHLGEWYEQFYESVRLWFAQRKGLIRERIPIDRAIELAEARERREQEQEFQRRYEEEQDMATRVRMAYQQAVDDQRNSAMMDSLARAFEQAS